MLVFLISRHTCTKCRKVILAYSEQLKLQTACSPCLYQLVQAGWTMLLMGDTLFQILSSKWRHPDRSYANTVANVVCVSFCHRTHGEEEGLTASSPAEPVGRRRDPMGHLPFGGNTLRERILGVMGTSLEIRHSIPRRDYKNSSLETIGEAPRD